ncbi:hypothetical protein E2C01_036202 [Portunus trituberculatus]|uniref:Uncharacterized protein n=1 Tax=Portunus trituberculatus TaxID=210409 RepID=A0A5B7F558_PORTR|nr:hypothetical protein [Portunus trituberculatus]
MQEQFHQRLDKHAGSRLCQHGKEDVAGVLYTRLKTITIDSSSMMCSHNQLVHQEGPEWRYQ